MRILIHTDEYYPTAQACSYRMRTMADAFIDQGDEVVVIASSTNKGNGKIESRREKILYSPAIRMKKKTTVMRMLNNFSFGFTSIFTSLKAGKIDVVITTSPPPLVSIPGWIIAKCKGAKLVYDVRDIWPDVALEMGSFAENSIYCKVFRAITRFMYKHADWVTNAVTSTMAALRLSCSSVTSYLPYEKGVYFPEDAEAENISAGAERQRHYRAVVALKKNPCEENLWKCVVAFREYKFKTMSGLPFTYTLKKGRGDEFTKERWIDRREGSKSLAWSSVLLAYHNIGKIGEVVDRPKALGDIRGVSYIYGMFYRFGLIDVPEKVKEKMTK